MSVHPKVRPGGRSERVRRAVLDAATFLAAEPDASGISVAKVAARSGVSEVTIYRRWRTIEEVVLEAAVDDVNRRLPLEPTGDLAADLTRWAQAVERSIATPQGRRMITATARLSQSPDTADASSVVRELLEARISRLQMLIDAADPPAAVTVEKILDDVLAPLYLRQLFGYRSPADGPVELVSRALSTSGSAPERDGADDPHPPLGAGR